jgi:hypothetical protein
MYVLRKKWEEAQKSRKGGEGRRREEKGGEGRRREGGVGRSKGKEKRNSHGRKMWKNQWDLSHTDLSKRTLRRLWKM